MGLFLRVLWCPMVSCQVEDLQNSKDNLNAELEVLQISKNDMKQSLDHNEHILKEANRNIKELQKCRDNIQEDLGNTNS